MELITPVKKAMKTTVKENKRKADKDHDREDWHGACHARENPDSPKERP